jgi:hypothetical protein
VAKASELMQQVIVTVDKVRYTFPVHIWFLAYHESLVTFRDALAKLYTPIHQLKYKLRNAQAKTY